MRSLSALRRDDAERARGRSKTPRPSISAGTGRDRLARRDEAGAARNAVDCALWDLEAKASGSRVGRMLGNASPAPLETAFTLSLGDTRGDGRAGARKRRAAAAQGQARRRRRHRPHPRRARGGARQPLILDANEGWTERQYRRKPRRRGRARRRADRAAAAGRATTRFCAGSRTRCRSAPTRACTRPPISTRWSASTTRSTSSSTRRAG